MRVLASAAALLTVVAVAAAADEFKDLPKKAVAGQPFTYKLNKDAGQADYLMLSGPKGMKVSKAGEITWTPEADQVGQPNQLVIYREKQKVKVERYRVAVVATAAEARSDAKDKGTAKGEDRPVKNGDTLPKKARVGQMFAYNLASGIKGGVAFVGIKGPTGLDLKLTGQITWTPKQDQVGTHELRLQFSGGGKSEFQTYKIVVEGDRVASGGGTVKPPTPTTKTTGKWELALKNGATIPRKAAAGEPFTFDLASGEGKPTFRPLFAPKGLSLTPEGRVAWTPAKGMVGPYKLMVEIRSGAKQEFHTYYVVVDGNPGRAVATFPLAPPSGWVMTPDNVTLIVSQPEKTQLVYFDTVANKEVKRVEVDFQPAALALQGKTLFAAARGSSAVYALDAATGKQIKEFSLGSDAVARLACHPSKGLLYASTTKFTVHAIDPQSGDVTLTDAKGFFLAVDPAAGKFLYTGIQPMRRDEYIWKEDASGRVRIIWDRWGTRGMLLKYAVDGRKLKQVSVQSNAAVNGWDMHLTPDGKRLMLVGGGGWRPKDEGSGGGYVVAVFSAAKLEAMVGQAPHGLSVAFHPVLDLGVTNLYGKELLLFKGKSLAKKGSVTICQQEERRPLLLTFGGKGTKVVVWNGEDAKHQQGLQFVPLDLTADDRAALTKVYGPLPASGGRK